MSYLIGTTAISEKVGRCRIKSVTVSAGAVAAVLTILPYGLTTYGNAILVKAAINDTTQVSFDGIPFDTGLLVSPDANVTSYIVEYAE